MFDFEKELENYNPVMEIGSIEDEISSDDMKDMIDILGAILKSSNE